MIQALKVRGQHESAASIGGFNPDQTGVLALGEVHAVLVENHEPAVAGQAPRLDLGFVMLDAITTFDRVCVKPGHVHATNLIATVGRGRTNTCGHASPLEFVLEDPSLATPALEGPSAAEWKLAVG